MDYIFSHFQKAVDQKIRKYVPKIFLKNSEVLDNLKNYRNFWINFFLIFRGRKQKITDLFSKNKYKKIQMYSTS